MRCVLIGAALTIVGFGLGIAFSAWDHLRIRKRWRERDK